TIYQIYLQQKWSQQTILEWDPIFDLFQEIAKKAILNPQNIKSDYFAYSEKVLLLLRDIASDDSEETYLNYSDKRFKENVWQKHPIYRWLQQHYLMTCHQIQDNLSQIEGLDHATSKKLRFYVKQFLDAISPSHFIMTNPQVLQVTFASEGKNIL